MTNEHKVDKQTGAAPAQGVTRRDFVQRATRAVIGGGILVGALVAPVRAMAGQRCPTSNTCGPNPNTCTSGDYCSNGAYGTNTCTSDACTNGDSCVTSGYSGTNTCVSDACSNDQCGFGNYPGTNTCTASDSCDGNTCCKSDGCQSYEQCASGSNYCENEHTCNADVCTFNNVCQTMDECNTNTCGSYNHCNGYHTCHPGGGQLGRRREAARRHHAAHGHGPGASAPEGKRQASAPPGAGRATHKAWRPVGACCFSRK